MNNDILEIALDQLNDVLGGQSVAPPVLRLPSPTIKPALPPPNQGMGFPKYSAGWWDLARASGNIK